MTKMHVYRSNIVAVLLTAAAAAYLVLMVNGSGGLHVETEVNEEHRSLLLGVNDCNEASIACNAILGIPGRRMYRNRSECSEKCIISLFVPIHRLLGWQCGICVKKDTSRSPTNSPTLNPTRNPTGRPTQDPAGQLCSATTTLTVTNYQQYDTVVIQGFDMNEVEWDVSFASKGSKIEFTVPYGTSSELNTIQALVNGITDLGLDLSLGYDTRLMIPDPKVAVQSCSTAAAKVHITVPKTVKTICFGTNNCRLVICYLGALTVLDRNDISYAPGNAEIFFGNSTECVIQKPPRWEEYVLTHFGNTTLDYNLYLYDTDGDGASNIVEFYGINLLSLYADYANTTGVQRNTNISSTDPKNPDTDGDLLLDGYELLYGSDPRSFRSVRNDTDGDGLTDLQEQIFGTDLFRNDTDNDGVSDRVETNEGSNPLDDTDFFIWNRSSTRFLQGTGIDACDPTSNSARIRLSVGDPSGSQSERYKIIVDGWVSHESPEFGKVDSGDYKIPAGFYTVRIEHVASKLNTPDYDYFASVTSLESTLAWRITVIDPSRLLGSHSESTFDYTVGKSATLNVTRVTSTSTNMCEQQKSCSTCRTDTNCRWDDDRKSCKEWCRFSTRDPYQSPETCPCYKCEQWYEVENDRSRKWIEDLPDCPCRVNVTRLPTSVPFYSRTRLIPIGSPYTWDEDLACNPESPNDCQDYHPGALGCIRTKAIGSESGQQCCYDKEGRIITKGRGAGTPDLVAGGIFSFYDHYVADVIPYEQCCVDCNEEEGCANYIGSDTKDGVRQETGECAGIK